MAVQPIDVTGGESVYCFNKLQLTSAFDLAESKTESGEKIRAALQTLEETLTRNERAATAFVLIDRLVKTKPE
jgi:hypothetical protein